MKRLFGLVALLLANNFSYGAWYVQEDGWLGHDNQVKVSDAEYEFSYREVSCKLSATGFNRASNDSIMEHRTLSCMVSIDTEVTAEVTCQLPRWEYGSLTIKKSGVYIQPVFVCGPNK